MPVEVGMNVDVEKHPRTVGRISLIKDYPKSSNNVGRSVFVEYPLASVSQSHPPEPSFAKNIKNAKDKGSGPKYNSLSVDDLEEAYELFFSYRVGQHVKPFYTGKVSRIVGDVVEVEYKNPVSLVPTKDYASIPNAPANDPQRVPKVSLKPVPGGNTRRRRNRRRRSTRRSN